MIRLSGRARTRLESGARGGIRTHDPRFRRPMLYPAELLSQMAKSEDHNQFSSLRKQLIKSAFPDLLQEPLINFLIQQE